MFRTFLATCLCLVSFPILAEEIYSTDSFFSYQGSPSNFNLQFEQFDPELGNLDSLTIEFYDVEFTWTEMGLTVLNNVSTEPVEFQYHGWNDFEITSLEQPELLLSNSYNVLSDTLTLDMFEWGNINYNPALPIDDPNAYLYTQSIDILPNVVGGDLGFAIGNGTYGLNFEMDNFRVQLHGDGEPVNTVATYHITVGQVSGNVRVKYEYSEPVIEAHAPEPSSCLMALVGAVITILGYARHFR